MVCPGGWFLQDEWMVPLVVAHHPGVRPRLAQRVSRLLMRPRRLTIARSRGCHFLGVPRAVACVLCPPPNAHPVSPSCGADAVVNGGSC